MFIDTNRHQRVINRLTWLLLVIVPLAMFPDGQRFNVAISKFASLGFISLVFLALIIVEKRFSLRLDLWENRFLLGYTLLLIGSTFFAIDPKLAVIGSEARMDGLITFAFYLVAYSLGRQVRVTEKFYSLIAISTAIISVYACLQFFKIDPPFLRLYADSWRGLAFSTMGNPNFLGSYLTLVLPLAIYFYLMRGKWWGLPFYALTYFALMATRTRGTWIGAAVGFIIMGILAFKHTANAKRTLRRLVILAVVSILLFALFILLTDEAMINKLLKMFTDLELIITKPEEADTAGTNRFYIWQRCVELIRQRPVFGFGVENMSLAMHMNFRDMIVQDFGTYRNWDKAHNEYLNIAVASGLPSLVLYLGFVATALVRGWRKQKECPMLVPFVAGVIGYLVQAFFNIQMIIVYYFFMASLGILVSQVFCLKEPIPVDFTQLEVKEEEENLGRDVHPNDNGHGV